MLPGRGPPDAGIVAVLRYLDNRSCSAWPQEQPLAEILEANPLMSFRLHGDGELVCQRPAIAQPSRKPPRIALPPPLPRQRRGSQKLNASTRPSRASGAHKPRAPTSSRSISMPSPPTVSARAPTPRSASPPPSPTPPHSTTCSAVTRATVPRWATLPPCSGPSKATNSETLRSPTSSATTPQGRPGVEAVRARCTDPSTAATFRPGGARATTCWASRPTLRASACASSTACTLRELAERDRTALRGSQHCARPNDPDYLSLFRLLVACASAGQGRQHPPQLGGAVIVGAILTDRDAPYPSLLLNIAVVRCRAEQEVTTPAPPPSRPA
jgi:CRISPR-associated protein Csd1